MIPFEEFIKTFNEENCNWIDISYNVSLTETFIEKHKDLVSWFYISQYQKISETFIEKYKDKVDWTNIFRYQKLSEVFIEKYKDKVNWTNISWGQKLSEAFIEKYKDLVNWTNISWGQKLSEAFIEKHKDLVNWFYICKFQKLSETFIEKHGIIKPKNSWLYATKKEKLQYIKENTNYEIVDDKYIIAYKSTRSDGYSVYNFSYHYEVGKTYESHCDCNLLNGNSFGLSAWTKEKALEYFCHGKLFKVKIDIEDIGAIVHENNKIRCFKLEILEEVEK
jgi:hypothetical protein